MSDRASPLSPLPTEETPPEKYAIRKCRGHWHVTIGEGADSDDLMVRGDPFKTAEEAQSVADRRNAGISWEEIERRPSPEVLRVAPSPLSLPTDIREALDRFHIASQRLNLAPELVHNHVTGTAVERAYSAARTALESLFREQQERESYLRKQWNLSLEAVADLQSELASLKKEQLTPEEKDAVLWWMYNSLSTDPDAYRTERLARRRSALVKIAEAK